MIDILKRCLSFRKMESMDFETWIDSNGFTINLVNWYLNDPQSRQWLENKSQELYKEYVETLDGDIRARWNHLSSLLNNKSISDIIKVKLFNRFLYGTNDKMSIPEIVIEQQEDGGFIPASL